MGVNVYMEDNMGLTELRSLAKEMGLKNTSKLKKNELIELIQESKKDKPLVKQNDDSITKEEKEEFVSRKWHI